MKTILLLLSLFLTGCYQTNVDTEDKLRTVPVTNNPNLIPKENSNSVTSLPY